MCPHVESLGYYVVYFFVIYTETFGLMCMSLVISLLPLRWRFRPQPEAPYLPVAKDREDEVRVFYLSPSLRSMHVQWLEYFIILANVITAAAEVCTESVLPVAGYVRPLREWRRGIPSIASRIEQRGNMMNP